jgi:V8-like Glu-specific endopeptidase
VAVGELEHTSTLVSGYPGDKSLGQQWRGDNVSRTVAVTEAEQVYYANDTISGMSGSAVYGGPHAPEHADK